MGDAYHNAFVQNGCYWKVVAYCTAMGGNILAFGSMSGLALIKMERIHIGWFFKNVGVKALVGGIIGLVVMVVIAQMSL